MFFIARSNDSFNFLLGGIKYIVIVMTKETDKKRNVDRTILVLNKNNQFQNKL